MPYYIRNKIASLIFVAVAAVFAGFSFARNLFFFNNPVGAGLNLATIIFLFGGIIFIARDKRRGPPLP